MSVKPLIDFIAAHEAFFSLLALAFVVNMPEELPWPLSKFRPLAWAWDWAHSALKTFVSFRSPKQ